ncbi:PAS domain S-box protein [Cytobacillus sp. FJAT-54145]|uniref:PAS domain S-box protein n=1 Tax=Cytobacillus spartinae TaxID=3299023 RepID=A0ABW6K8I6_9BACI
METVSQFNWGFELITKHMMDILLIVDRNQSIIFATPSIESMLGYSIEGVIGKNAFEFLHPEDKNELIKSHQEVIRLQQSVTNEYRAYDSKGNIKYLESRVMPVPNHPEQIVAVTIRDVTLRKNIENEIQNRRNRYQLLQNSLKSYSQEVSNTMRLSELEVKLVKELETVITNSEPKVIIYNRESETFVGDSSLKMCISHLTVGKQKAFDDRVFILIGDRNHLSYFLTIDAAAIEDKMESIYVDTLVYYTVMVFESLSVIENLMNQLETALKWKERPQWISRLLFNLSEKQRLELSSNLHHTVLLDQFTLYRRLEVILKEQSFNREVKEELIDVSQGLLDSIHQIKITCNDLRPPLLREIGLVSALENIFEFTQVSSTYKIAFTTKNTSNLSLDDEQTIGIYRVVQELLNNATKHSEATNLHFHLSQLEDQLILQYLDNGKGFNESGITPSFNSMGISGMRERVQSLNGSIKFHSKPGEGLLVRIKIPSRKITL